MFTTFHVRANELDERFLNSLKTLYRDKQIEIIVSEVDETAYLLQSDANRAHLLNAIANIEAGENLIAAEALSSDEARDI